MIQIYPSLLAADFSRLKEEITMVEKAGADGLHLDIMDGHFVPNITFGPVVIRSIRKVTDMPFWSHLMIEEPERYIEDYVKAGVQGITIHAEISGNIRNIIDQIHIHNIGAGISLKPDTDLDPLIPMLCEVERIMIMTVNPGFGGQSFMRKPLGTMRKLSALIRKWKKSINIEVDGGINLETVGDAAAAGADVLIAGSAIFRAENPAEALKQMRSTAEAAISND